jgi:hypothetical protein
MIHALAMPAATPEQRAVRSRAIARARTGALAATGNRPISEDLMSRVDRLLGLPAADPTLGLAR